MFTDEPTNALLDRRSLLGGVLAGAAGLALGGSAHAQQEAAPLARANSLDPDGGSWRTWIIPSGRAIRVAAPAGQNSARTEQELRELIRLQSNRNKASRAVVEFWDPQGGVTRWTQILLDTIKATSTNPVLASRAIALVHTAMADAAIAAWSTKFSNRRRSPERISPRIKSISDVDPLLPSYVSEHAAIAAAAATVLNYLYPAQTYVLNGATYNFAGLANQAAFSRLVAGANFRSDVEAGLLLGAAVGRQAVLRGQTDGSANTSAVTIPTGPQYWFSIANPAASPLLPRAGQWTPWVLERGDQYRPIDPAIYVGGNFSSAFLAEVQTVKDTVANLTDNQKAIANFWADNPGVSFTPPGHWTQIAAGHVAAKEGWSAVRAARAMAMVGVGVADAAICCWDAKYAFWMLRPVNAIRTIQGQAFSDPSWNSFIPTPNFPSFTSGHSTFSGASAAILEYLFPGGTVTDALGQQVSFEEASDQAALSRLYGGIHYPIDNNLGLEGGRMIAQDVIRRARRDGA